MKSALTLGGPPPASPAPPSAKDSSSKDDVKTTASGAAYVEPSFRAYQPWNPQLILGAELLCDGGTLRAAADLCEQMLADDRLSAVLNKRILGMLGLDLTFDPARGRRTPVKKLESDEDWWTLFPEEELGDVLKWGTVLGVGLGNMAPWMERPDHGGRVLGTLNAWSARHLTWQWQRRQWTVRVEGGRDVDIWPTGEPDGIWMLYTPYGKKRPWAKGLWRGLSRWWLLKQYALYDWGKYSERHGQGVFVASNQPGISAGLKDRQQLAADIQQMARAAAIALPPGIDLKLVEATANNWQTFKAQIDAANMAFAITLLGNNLSTEVTGGSFAAADVHKVVEATQLRFTAKTAADFCHDQALTKWAELNFGSADVASWPHWAVEPPEDLAQLAALWVQFGLSLKSFATYKIPVDLKAMCDAFKVPLMEGAEVPEVLELPPPPPSPFGGGGPGEGDGEGDQADDGDPDADAEGDDEDTKKSKALRRMLRAAPHTHVKAAVPAGMKNGRAYADRVASSAKKRASAALEKDVRAVRAAIAAADSFEDLRKRLVETFKDMDPKALAKIVHHATMMSTLAGRASVKEDAK